MHDNCARRSAGGFLSCSNAGTISISGDRRGFISGIASAGLGAVASSTFGRLTPLFAPTPVLAKDSLIDVHHHFVPPFYFSENRERIAAVAGGSIPAMRTGLLSKRSLQWTGRASRRLFFLSQRPVSGSATHAPPRTRHAESTNTRRISSEVIRLASASLLSSHSRIPKAACARSSMRLARSGPMASGL